MKVRLNEDKEIVARIKEGLKRTGGYCPCRLAHTEENKCMCEEFRNLTQGNKTVEAYQQIGRAHV